MCMVCNNSLEWFSDDHVSVSHVDQQYRHVKVQ